VGIVVAISSTAVVLKQLSDQGELPTMHGRIIIGILLFEDLAAVAFLLLVDAWSGAQQTDAFGVAKHLGIASLAFAAVAFVSRPLFKGMLARVARLRSNDLMLLSSLALALGTAFLTHRFGLSPPIGAFLAGMVIGETDLRHQVEDDVRPFRDLLLGLFFVTIGMEIDLSVLLSQPEVILVWLALFAGKSLIVAGVTSAFGWPLPVAARVGACLAQGSEFGMLLLTRAAMGSGILTSAVGPPALIAISISMGVAPLIVQHNERAGLLFGGRQRRPTPPSDETAVRKESEQLSDHVVLLGCGRVGRLVAAVLEAARIPYLAFEKNFENFQEAKRRGHRIVWADGSRSRLLKAAGLRRARLLVITFDDRHALERILLQVRHENQALLTLVSSSDDREAALIAEAGASVVYPENLAAGLALGDQSLIMLGLSQDEAASVVAALRTELNPDLRGHVGC
jgi:CPA2 family monovalent cation:H+ antiporter-2